MTIGIWEGNKLDIKDIVWPGNSPVPPPGVPEKFNLKITFLKEPPYVNLLPPDNETGECKTSRSIKCRVAPEHKLIGFQAKECVVPDDVRLHSVEIICQRWFPTRDDAGNVEDNDK
ncbi:glutamate receptor ionotropic, NMDA 2B [Trichonephila clavipes]|nr:glutamate receptor ionotropic, NMDA 2B [Trichonephila clavipes]